MSRSDISTTPAPAPDVRAADGVPQLATCEAVELRAGAPVADAAVWVIQSYRAGENSQLLGLAERLGRPYRVVSVGYRGRAGLLALLRMTTLAGIDADGRARLTAPWPELVITAGLRNEPLCTWIRRASGGRTRIVFIGRTWRPHKQFDLLVTTPQYRIQSAPTVLVNLMTQHRVTPERLQEAAGRHAALCENRPRPLIGVLLGGSSGPYVLGPASAARLRGALAALVSATGGSLWVTSSSRTPEPFFEALTAPLEGAAIAYRWRPDDPSNPYYGMLALADVLVVTGDSVAMLSEAAATGKPVLVFDIPTDAAGDSSMGARFYRWMMRWLPRRLTRDVAEFHRRFMAAGYGRFLDGAPELAVWLGAWQRQPAAASDGTRERIDALFSDQPTGSADASPMRPRSTR